MLPNHHHVPAVFAGQCFADLLAYTFQIPRRQSPTRRGRGANAHDRDVRAEDCLGWIGGDGQPARTHYFGREFTDPFLDNWCLAPAQELHFVAVGIDADYVVATCRQACRRYAADVPKAENAYGQ